MAEEFTCDVCGATLSSRVEYEQHMTAQHPGSPRGETRLGGGPDSEELSPDDLEAGEASMVGDTRGTAASGGEAAPGDIGIVGEPADVNDITSVRDEGSVGDAGKVHGRAESDVGDWMMGENDDVRRRSSGSEPTTFRCSYCGEQFDDQDDLIEHVDSTHRRGEMTA